MKQFSCIGTSWNIWNIQSTSSLECKSVRSFTGLALVSPVSPTTIPSDKTAFHDVSCPAQIILGLYILHHFANFPHISNISIFLCAPSGLERGRHYKVCVDVDGVGSLQMVDTLREAGQFRYDHFFVYLKIGDPEARIVDYMFRVDPLGFRCPSLGHT